MYIVITVTELILLKLNKEKKKIHTGLCKCFRDGFFPEVATREKQWQVTFLHHCKNTKAQSLEFSPKEK